jgi:1,4-alpha-glucan branching enzyme
VSLDEAEGSRAMPYRFLDNGKIRFEWPAEKAREVFLVGDFNRWDEKSHRLQKSAKNRYQIELEIPPGKYQFKFLIDGIWYNDPDADEYEYNAWGSEDSVIWVRSH